MTAATASEAMSITEAARTMGVSRSTAHDSCRRFLAAREMGDAAAMLANVPCHRLGRRITIPRATFRKWWLTCGRAS
jgi:transposase-like protein